MAKNELVIKDDEAKKDVVPKAKKEDKTKENKHEEKVEVTTDKDLSKVEEKKEKRKRFFDEVKSFFILALIIALVALGGWYWYTHIYNDKTDKKEKPAEVAKEFKAYNYESEENYLDVVGDKYIVEYRDNSIYKVLDFNTNVLFEGQEDFDGWFIDKKDNLYFYSLVDEGYSNAVSLYVLENGEIKLVKELYDENYYYAQLFVNTDSYNGVIGYIGMFTGYNENGEPEHREKIYILNGKEYELTNISLYSDRPRLAVDDNFVIYDEKNVIYCDNDGRYGVYDVVNNKEVVSPTYERLYRGLNDNYIAIRDEKAGIVDLKLKKLVDFEYDFIDANSYGYVLGKDNKLALMSIDNKLITDFDFDYQDPMDTGYLYTECCGNTNSFELYKVKDKYLLVSNVLESEGLKYEKHESYLISNDGSYETIVENDINIDLENEIIWIYSNDTKEYTFYDLEFKELYKLDFKEYDNSENIRIEVFYGTLIARNRAISLYYDLSTGEKLDSIKDYEYTLETVKFKYNGEDSKVIVTIDNKEVAQYSYKEDDMFRMYIKLSSDRIVYYNRDTFLMIQKDE